MDIARSYSGESEGISHSGRHRRNTGVGSAGVDVDLGLHLVLGDVIQVKVKVVGHKTSRARFSVMYSSSSLPFYPPHSCRSRWHPADPLPWLWMPSPPPSPSLTLPPAPPQTPLDSPSQRQSGCGNLPVAIVFVVRGRENPSLPPLAASTNITVSTRRRPLPPLLMLALELEPSVTAFHGTCT